MVAYYVTFKEYMGSPRGLVIEFNSDSKITLETVISRLSDYGVKKMNLVFVFGWSKIEN